MTDAVVCAEMCQVARAVADFTWPAIGAILAALAKKAWDLMGLAKDSQMRGLVQLGLERGLEHAREVAHQYALNLDDLQVRNAMVDHAAKYAASAYPDAIRHFKLEDKRDRLVQMGFALIETPASAAATPLTAPARRAAVAPGLAPVLGDGTAGPPKASSALLSLI